MNKAMTDLEQNTQSACLARTQTAYTVLLGLVLLLAGTASAAPATISGAQSYQTIDGFGVNANHRSWYNTELQPVLDALIDQGGMTLFHVVFDNNNWETTNDNSNPYVMNWAYYTNVYSAPEFQQLWGIMAYLNQRGITNGLVPVFQGPVPLWMGGLSLTPGFEVEYAETIASAVVYARNMQHLQFTQVGPANEEDLTYTGIHMTGAGQYVTMLHDLAQMLDTNGLSDVRFVGPDLANTATSWLSQMMNDPVVMSKVNHFGLHSYQGMTADSTGVYNFLQQSAYPDRNFWMTEFGVWCAKCQAGTSGDGSWTNARGIASFLLSQLANGAAGACVWEGYDSQYVDFNPATGGNDPPHWSYWGLFAVDDINAPVTTYTARKQFYTVSQISKFVRPGARRIYVGGSTSPLTLLAFYEPKTGQVTLTGVNTSSNPATLSSVLTNLPAIANLDLYYTDSTTNLCHSATIPLTNNAFTTTIPGDCVFTLSGFDQSKITVSVLLTNPPDGASYPAPTDLPLQATAAISNGLITSVSFFCGTNNLGQAVTAPYGILWSNVPPGTYALTAQATSSGGYVGVSPAVQVTLVGTAMISQQPQNEAVAAGGTALFTVSASAVAPLSYQWQFNGTNLAGATQTALDLTNAQSGNAGSYSVVISNVYGAITSAAAVLTVTPALPSIATQPADQAARCGGSASFSAAPSGSEPFTWQWQLNGTNLIGATNSTLILTNVQLRDVGVYQAVVGNAYGSVFSSNANLTLVPSFVAAWGDNSLGQTNVPEGLTNVTAISAGALFSLALNRDGSVAGWGYDVEGQVGIPPTLTNAIAVAGGGFHSLALRSDHTVVAWGDNTEGQTNVPPTLTNAVAIAAGDSYSLALKSDGTVVGWGYNGAGETNVPASLSNVVAIAAAGFGGLALKSDGTVAGWGAGATNSGSWLGYGQTVVPAGLSGVVAIAAGEVHSLALKNDGTVVAWGYDSDGQTSVPPGLSNAVAIAAGYYSSLALKGDGTVVGWGRNNGQLSLPADLTTVVGVSSGMSHSVALANDGSAFIARQPFDQAARSGTAAVLSVGALGLPPLGYQWRFNGTNLAGATNCVLKIQNARLANAGGYQVLVSNTSGSVTSRVATLSVTGPAILADNTTFGLRSNRFSFNVASPPGQAVVVEASTNFVRWVPVQTNFVTVAGWFVFADRDTSKFPRRFYRARLFAGTLPPPAIRANDGMLGFKQGRFGFNLAGVAGQTVIVETSTNLVNWTPMATNLLAVDPLYFSDPSPTNSTRRFYRLRLN
jgi:O-glycosyl hydrolase